MGTSNTAFAIGDASGRDFTAVTQDNVLRTLGFHPAFSQFGKLPKENSAGSQTTQRQRVSFGIESNHSVGARASKGGFIFIWNRSKEGGHSRLFCVAIPSLSASATHAGVLLRVAHDDQLGEEVTSYESISLL